MHARRSQRRAGAAGRQGSGGWVLLSSCRGARLFSSATKTGPAYHATRARSVHLLATGRMGSRIESGRIWVGCGRGSERAQQHRWDGRGRGEGGGGWGAAAYSARGSANLRCAPASFGAAGAGRAVHEESILMGGAGRGKGMGRPEMREAHALRRQEKRAKTWDGGERACKASRRGGRGVHPNRASPERNNNKTSKPSGNKGLGGRGRGTHGPTRVDSESSAAV
jgi:hypothetical protein